MRGARRAFATDPDQNAMGKGSEKDGPIIEHSNNWYLQPVDLSPLPSTGSQAARRGVAPPPHGRGAWWAGCL